MQILLHCKWQLSSPLRGSVDCIGSVYVIVFVVELGWVGSSKIGPCPSLPYLLTQRWAQRPISLYGSYLSSRQQKSTAAVQQDIVKPLTNESKYAQVYGCIIRKCTWQPANTGCIGWPLHRSLAGYQDRWFTRSNCLATTQRRAITSSTLEIDLNSKRITVVL